MDSVLAGRRVVVTRAAEQADDLAALLAARGAVPIVIPLIEIVPAAAGIAELAAAVTGKHEVTYDWLIVTSPNGAAHVVDAVNAVNAVVPRVAAIGTTTAEVLRAGGIAVSLVPAVQSAAGLLAEIRAAGAASGPVAGSVAGSVVGSVAGSVAGSVLLVQAANADAALADGLRELSPIAGVTIVAPYRTVPARVTAAQQLAALSADAVLFASGSAAHSWAAVFGDSAPPVVVAIGPQTAAAASDAGLKVAVLAADHSLSGMVTALERHLSSQG